MTDFEKLMFMYTTCEGAVTTQRERNRFEIIEDDYGNGIGLKYVKEGRVCFTMSREELLFKYITMNWGKTL